MTATVDEIVPGRTAVVVYVRLGVTTRRLSRIVVAVREVTVQVPHFGALEVPLLELEDGTQVLADPRLPIEVATP